jgi:hypothetical protein
MNNETKNEKTATHQIDGIAELHEAELASVAGAAMPDPNPKPHPCWKWPNTSQSWGF